MWLQEEFKLSAKKRGFHIITHEVIRSLPDLSSIETGLINENADPDVRHDLESHFNQFAPESAAYYRHNDEGSDVRVI